MTRPDASSSPHETPRDPDEDRRVGPPPDEADEIVETDAEPGPEPWTPERVLEWNAYYDLYVVGAALLLAFVTSAVRVNHSPLWSNLRMGREILAQGTPLLADAFSYTEEGKRWVNVPWLFQAASAGLYNLVYGMVPESPDDPTSHRASAEQVATGALVALTALIRMATAYVLIRIRRPGPGVWWSAVCAALAVGAAIGPRGLAFGGIALPAAVDPSTWGVFFLAIECWLLFRAFDQSRRNSLFALVPLFLAWANVDDSFLVGLLILAAATVGRLLDERRAAAAAFDRADSEGRAPVSGAAAGATLLASALVVLANPSHVGIYPAALEPVARLFGGPPTNSNQLSYFGKTIRDSQFGGIWFGLMVFYGVWVAAGAATFALNAARFRWSRFLPFASAALIWAAYMRYSPEFAIVLAAVASLNGQEWYQARFGTRGRLGTGWVAWSTGGRLATLAAIFACVAFAITGFLKKPGEARFGFGFDPNDYAFRAADYLASRDDIKGNVFNWSPAQGDALVWRAGPTRQTFVDNRTHLFPVALAEKHRSLLNALRDDDPAVWKPVFDEYKITTVMVDAETAVNTFRRLSSSPNWVPFYDDGKVGMFGRADAAEPDATTFKANRLDPELRAYKASSPTPSPDRPPTPVEFIDYLMRSRALTPARSQTNSARRWLTGATDPDGSAIPPDPARCLLAIREARSALAQNPDDTLAYRLLSIAYRALAQQEAAILSGIPLTPENRGRIAAIQPGGTMMTERLRQVVTSLKYAVDTTPPPADDEGRRELISLQLELFEVYGRFGFVDLARDRLQAALDLARPGDLVAESRAQFATQLQQLNEQVARIEQAVGDLQLERQAGPIELGQFALGQGAAGLAIIQFEDANRSNLSPIVVKPQLVDLYCSTGQPERSLEVIQPSGGVDPNLGEPSAASFRQGLIYKLMGNYSYAAMLWQTQALPRLAFDRTSKAIGVAGRSLQGDMVSATNEALSIPGMVTREANWEFDLAQCLLEWGEPERAAEHYTRVLELAPTSAYRPLIAYYLEKIGKPVPAPPTATADEPASPGETRPEGGAKPGPAEEPKATEDPKAADGPKAEPAPKAGAEEAAGATKP